MLQTVPTDSDASSRDGGGDNVMDLESENRHRSKSASKRYSAPPDLFQVRLCLCGMCIVYAIHATPL